MAETNKTLRLTQVKSAMIFTVKHLITVEEI